MHGSRIPLARSSYYECAGGGQAHRNAEVMSQRATCIFADLTINLALDPFFYADFVSLSHLVRSETLIACY